MVVGALVTVTLFFTYAVQVESVQHSCQPYFGFVTHVFPGSHGVPSEQHMLASSVHESPQHFNPASQYVPSEQQTPPTDLHSHKTVSPQTEG